MKLFSIFKAMTILLLVIILKDIPLNAGTNDKSDELFQMSMDDFFNVKIISASKSEENIFDSPLSTTVITREEIENSGVLSIPEALKLSPGIIVREKSNGNYDIHIRGNDNVPPGSGIQNSENTITLVMIDNRPVYSPFQGGTFWETLPINLNDIEKIEIIRGPSTALYGPNAVSGVINILTSKILSKGFSINTDFQGDVLENSSSNLSIGYNLNDKFKIKINGNYQQLQRSDDDFYLISKKKFIDKDSLAYYLNDTITYVDENFEPLYTDITNGDSLKNALIKDDELALEKFAVYTNFQYILNDQTNFDLGFGLQKSTSQSTYYDNKYISMTTRESDTRYVDLKMNIFGLSAQANYLKGTQDNAYGFNGFKFDVESFNSNLEYEYKIKKIGLTMRPGINYSTTTFNDKDYIDSPEASYFKEKVDLYNYAYFLRTDYRLSDNIRFIAAVRNDKYSLPDQDYPSYQFITIYNMNKNNNLRFVYSRANRGPFVYDTHINYKDVYNSSDFTFIQEYKKNETLNLLTMDSYEIGLRHKFNQNIYMDFEFFHTKTQDYNQLTRKDTTILSLDSLGSLNIEQLQIYQKQNIDLAAKQFGLIASLNMVLSSQINLKVFGTIQETYLNDMKVRYYPGDINGDGNNYYIETLEDVKHKFTPAFYGGLICNYNPVNNLNINSNLYYYSEHKFNNYIEDTVIDNKLTLNLKIDYTFWGENSIFLNARNILNNSTREFAFADKTEGKYMLGLKFNY